MISIASLLPDFKASFFRCSGMDDPFTEEINEGKIGSGIDDPFTEGINEGRW